MNKEEPGISDFVKAEIVGKDDDNKERDESETETSDSDADPRHS